jgi:hypothetical protein
MKSTFFDQRKPRQRKPLKVPRAALKECHSLEDLEALLTVFVNFYERQIDRYEDLLRELCEGDRTVPDERYSRWMRLWDNFLYANGHGPGPFERIKNFKKLMLGGIKGFRTAAQMARDSKITLNALRATANCYLVAFVKHGSQLMIDFAYVDRILDWHGLGDYSPRGPQRLKKGGSGK